MDLNKCEACNKKKKDVKERIDPYYLAIDGVYRYVVWCDRCSANRELEI